MWQRDISELGECPDEDAGSDTINRTSTTLTHTIRGLEGDISCIITVRASNAAGSSEHSTVTARTLEGCEKLCLPQLQYLLFCVHFSAAPSAPPSSISATSTPTTITVQWGIVPCSHRNGVIVAFTLRYSGGGRTELLPYVGGANARQFTLSRLTPSTDYTIEVAAINDFAVGVYSTGMVERTLGELMMTACIIHVAICLHGGCLQCTRSQQ